MSILITGGTGSFGHAFVHRLLTTNGGHARIAILSRGEHRQFLMAQEFKELDKDKRLRFFIGDVRDQQRLRRAMQDIHVVVHAAALKRIEVGFYNPAEMVKTNVDGAINVIEAAQDAGVERVVALSSDKAWQPISPYGQSKALAESIFLAANNIRGDYGPTYSVCRYGNVWGSTGSVVPTWRKMIASGIKQVPVTDPNCTRFFMRMSEAVALVCKTIDEIPDGIAIPTLPAFRLGDLAEAMNIKMNIIGLPTYEKLHEGMADGNTSDRAARMSVAELKEALDET